MTEAALFYDAAKTGLGDAFLDDIQHAIDTVRERPHLASQWRNNGAGRTTGRGAYDCQSQVGTVAIADARAARSLVAPFNRSLDCTEMALSEFERKRCEKIVGGFIERRRPPAHIRPKLDLGFRVHGQSVEIFEIRPRWNSPKEKLEHSVAKATFVKSTGAWRIYWQRADLKWHRYDPAPEVGSLEEFVELVNDDDHACFWG